MRKILIIGLLLSIGFGTAEAGRRRPMSGTVKDNLYTDRNYGFTLTLNKDWKYSLRKETDNFRLLLTKRNYDIPRTMSALPIIPRFPESYSGRIPLLCQLLAF